MNVRLKLLLLVTTLVADHPSLVMAQPVTLNFNDLAGMQDVPGSLVPDFARLSNQYLASHGIAFSSDSGAPYVAIVSLGGGNNAIGSVDAGGMLAYDAGFHVEFFLPGDPSVAAGTDRFLAGFNARGMMPRVASIQGFGIDGNLITGNYSGTPDVGIESTVGIGPLPAGGEDPVLLFHSIQFAGGFIGQVAWDDFAFSTPVPEPSTVMLGALGMAAVAGSAWFRKRRKAT